MTRIWPLQLGKVKKGTRTKSKRICKMSPADHPGPAPGDSRALLLHDEEGRLSGLGLSHLAPVGVGVEARVSHGDLTFFRDMRGEVLNGEQSQPMKLILSSLGLLPIFESSRGLKIRGCHNSDYQPGQSFWKFGGRHT